MSKPWAPQQVDHSELKAQRAGIVGPFMVCAAILVALVFFIVIQYAFAGVQFDGTDLAQSLTDWNVVLTRLGNISDAFNPNTLVPFLLEALRWTTVTGFVVFMIIMIRRMYRAK